MKEFARNTRIRIRNRVILNAQEKRARFRTRGFGEYGNLIAPYEALATVVFERGIDATILRNRRARPRFSLTMDDVHANVFFENGERRPPITITIARTAELLHDVIKFKKPTRRYFPRKLRQSWWGADDLGN